MIDMLLKAGGAKEQIQTTLQNGVNALFFAVKYADLKAVDTLIAAGVKIDQRDESGCTCLKNALEHPQPPIIERLLDYLPVTDTLQILKPNGDDFYQESLADHMIQLMVNAGTMVSWVNLGPPSPEALNDAMIQLRKKGCRFSGLHFGGVGDLSSLGYLFQTDVTIPSEWNSPESFRELARTLVGDSIPESLRPPEEAGNEEEKATTCSEAFDSCAICHEIISKKKVSLYCGHTFCLECIIVLRGDSNAACPGCHAPLCIELKYGQAGSFDLPKHHLLGLTQTAVGHGIEYLTDDQVVKEAKYQGIFYPAATPGKLRSLLRADVPAEPMKTTYTANGVEEQAELTVDLSVALSTCGNGQVFLKPGHGRVSIEISVKDVPLVAYIANRNAYTMISKSVVEQLRLRRIEDLQSRKFVETFCLKKIRSKKFTCLEKFTLMVGNIEVTLRNAVEVDPDPYPLFGIQLGQDFLSSGVWCPIDIFSREVEDSTDEPSCYRVERDFSWEAKAGTKEMFRYYSRDGRSVHLPLLHFSPFDRNVLHGISLRSNIKFDVCYWCYRTFPEGMKTCGECQNAGRTVTYCDIRCQKAARKIHKKICGLNKEWCQPAP